MFSYIEASVIMRALAFFSNNRGTWFLIWIVSESMERSIAMTAAEPGRCQQGALQPHWMARPWADLLWRCPHSGLSVLYVAISCWMVRSTSDRGFQYFPSGSSTRPGRCWWKCGRWSAWMRSGRRAEDAADVLPHWWGPTAVKPERWV